MTQKNRILILDDEEATLFAFKETLTHQSLAVDTAQSLAEVEQLLLYRSYNGAVLELRLNGSDNYEGLNAMLLLKKHNPHCKIIILTAYGKPHIKEKALRMEADYFIEKPVSHADNQKILQFLGVLEYKNENMLINPQL